MQKLSAMATENDQKDKMPKQILCGREPGVQSYLRVPAASHIHPTQKSQEDQRSAVNSQLLSKRFKLRTTARSLIQDLARLTWKTALSNEQADRLYQLIVNAIRFDQHLLLTPEVTLLTLEVISVVLQHKFYSISARSIFLTEIQQCQSKEELRMLIDRSLD